MSRMLAVTVGAIALTLCASVAGAEERADLRAEEIASDAPTAPQADGAAAALAGRALDGTARAVEGPAFEPLTDEEIDALREAEARNPELANKTGGYVSNEELLTIVLVVLLIVIII